VQIMGADDEHDVRNVTFENVSINGSMLNEDSSRLRIGEHVHNVQFELKNKAVQRYSPRLERYSTILDDSPERPRNSFQPAYGP
jgi:hypothetical protein